MPAHLAAMILMADIRDIDHCIATRAANIFSAPVKTDAPLGHRHE